MLYRSGGKCVWASKQGQWRWDTDYTIETDVREGGIATRLLTADGKTEIAASPRIALTEDERARTGLTGLHLWRGTGTFWDFSDQW